MSTETVGADKQRGGLSDLFGRGMIYVLLWSLQLFLATIVSPILAHTIEPREFGRVSASIALYTLIMLVSNLGLDQALEMKRVEEKDPDAPVSRGLLASAIVIAWVQIALAAALMPVWSPLLGFDRLDPLVIITLLWALPACGAWIILAMLQAEDRLAPFAAVSIFTTAGTLGFGLVLIFTLGRTAEVYAWGGVIGQGIAFLIGLIVCRPRWRRMWQPKVIKAALALGVPIALAGLSQYVLTTADRFLIQRWMGSVEVARYQVAFTVGNALTLVLLFTNKAWLPRLKAITDTTVRWRAVTEARDGIYHLLSWALLGITVSAPVLLRVVAPPSYHLEPLVTVVFVVALAAFPVASITSSTQIMVTESTSRPLLIGGTVAVAVKVLITVLGVSYLGLAGAALGTTLAILAQAGVLRWIVARRHRGGHASGGTALLVVVTMAIAALSTFLPQTGVWFWGRFAFSCLCLIPFFLAWRGLMRSSLLEGEASPER